PRGRRDGTAAFHHVDLPEQHPDEPAQRPAEHAGPDLHLVRVGGSRRPQAGVGARARAACVRARHQPAGARRARPQPEKAGPVTEEGDVSETVTMPPMRPVDVAAREGSEAAVGESVFDISGLTVRYGSNVSIKDSNVQIQKTLITAVIGPSGCGKSTFIRCLNRMNDTVSSFNLDGKLLFHGVDLYGDNVEPIGVRRRTRMSVPQSQ